MVHNSFIDHLYILSVNFANDYFRLECVHCPWNLFNIIMGNSFPSYKLITYIIYKGTPLSMFFESKTLSLGVIFFLTLSSILLRSSIRIFHLIVKH